MITSLSPLPQMVMYESARAMVNLKNVTARELQPAVSGSLASNSMSVRPFMFDWICCVCSAPDVSDIGQTNNSICCRQDSQQGKNLVSIPYH